MAEINTGEGGGGRKKGHKVRAKKASTKIDFTPMVDLGFLLITFFMLTTTMSKPQTMQIDLPVKDDNADPTKLAKSTVLTVVLADNDKIYYYNFPEDPNAEPVIELTDYSANGIRKILLERNAPILSRIKVVRAKLDNKEITEQQYKDEVKTIKEDKKALMVLVKPQDDSNFKNLVDMLDELNISQVSRRAITEVEPVELEWIKKSGK